MANTSPSVRALLVAEGSGGHLIPALEVAGALAEAGARVQVWYAHRPHLARLAEELTRARAGGSVEIRPMPLQASAGPLARLWRCGALWLSAHRGFDSFAPAVVVGFGGWVSVPVILAARQRGIACMLHEQNAVLGGANRWLARRVDGVALSFPETQGLVAGVRSVVTGMPVRRRIGAPSRAQSARSFGLAPERPTLLILGGSQGSHAVNRLVVDALEGCTATERSAWQLLHVSGPADERMVRDAYVRLGAASWVAPFLVDMEAAYAQADLVVARAGASTIAELARCGLPAILIPYPYAGGHQRVNAEAVEASGGGLMIEESEATPARLLAMIRRILLDRRLRAMMGEQARSLSGRDAAGRLAREILALARRGTRFQRTAPAPSSERVPEMAGVA